MAHRFQPPASIILVILSGALCVAGCQAAIEATATPAAEFDGQRAYSDVLAQVALGPRTPGSSGHAAIIEYIRAELQDAGWMAEVQSATSMAHPIKNIVGRRGAGHGRTILGAHYDTRLVADQDPDPAKRLDPVPGANDGASGVAVLLELARTLPTDILDVELVFFDAEDNGYIDGWDWVLGSRAFVTSLATTPDAMILVDMVGDTDLRLPREANSDAALTASIWGVANRLGHGEIFIDEMGPAILDDHVPFLEAGIPAVDIIDFDYDYWHTTQDTPDKVSAESLEIVGSTILEWLKQEEPR